MITPATYIPNPLPSNGEPPAKKVKSEEDSSLYLCCNGQVKLRPLPLMQLGRLAVMHRNLAFVEYYPLFAEGVFEQQRSQFTHFWNRRKIVTLSDGTTLKDIFSHEDNDFFQRLAGFIRLLEVRLSEHPSDTDLWVALHRETSSQFRGLVKRYDLSPLADDPPLISACKKFLLDYSQLLYRKIDPTAALSTYIKLYIENNTEIVLENEIKSCYTTGQLVSLIRQIHGKLELSSTDPNALCYYETDLYKAGYIPTYSFRAFDVDFLLTPYPLKTTKSGEIRFHGEFQTYLESIKIDNTVRGRQNSHLYVNLMCRKSVSPKRVNEFRTEIHYSSVLESYQEKCPSELLILGLDRTSQFYFQTGKYKNQIYTNIETFKEDCLRHLFEDTKTSFFFMPAVLTKEKCNEIFDAVFSEYFDLEFLKSLNQRTVFLEIFQAKIVAYLCKELNPLTMNISCSRTVDRGPSFMAMLYCLHVQETKGSLDDEDKIKIMTLLFAPGAFSLDRAIYEERIVIFNLALQKLFPDSSVQFDECELVENNQ